MGAYWPAVTLPKLQGRPTPGEVRSLLQKGLGFRVWGLGFWVLGLVLAFRRFKFLLCLVVTHQVAPRIH